MPNNEPGPDEMEAQAKRLADALLDAFAAGGPEALSKARDYWRERAAGLPTLVQQRRAKLVLRMALERISNP